MYDLIQVIDIDTVNIYKNQILEEDLNIDVGFIGL